MITSVDDFLDHYGTKGMRWGVRKAQDKSPPKETSKSEGMSNKKKAAIIFGSVAGVAALAVGATYAKKHMNVPMSEIGQPSESVKKFSEAMAREPVGIVHSSRGKNRGFTFPQHGGLTDPLREYDDSGLTRDLSDKAFLRYGKNNEKIAARFLDPEGRKDAAGRIIPHEVILPESMARGVNTHDEAVAKAWPLIKDIYRPFYRSEAGSYGPGY